MDMPSEAINQVSEVSRQVRVDFLYLDNKTCARCGDTGRNLEQALGLAAPALRAVGVEIVTRRIHVDSIEAARRHQFAASPTIRVNGQDIAAALRESNCGACGDGCGCDGIQCRVWRYRGQEHESAPVGLIVNAILAAAYQTCAPKHQPEPYGDVPANLKRFFSGSKGRAPAGTACCG